MEDEADIVFLQFVSLFDAEFVYGLLKKKIFTGPGPVEHSKYAPQCGLAGPGRAHHGDELPRLNVQRNTTQHKVFPAGQIVSNLQLLTLDECRHYSPFALINLIRLS